MLPATPPRRPPRERVFFNGLGGFTPDGREYVITLAPGQTTPAPWANVLANAQIGTVVTESGGAYTWVDNAHEFRLTPWHNDPVGDTSGEAFYIRDEETGQFWSPTPLPARGHGTYVCRHGFGYSVFEYTQFGISSELWTYVALDAPVKLVVVKLRNRSGRPRRLSVTGYWELVLGQWRHANLMHVVTEIDPNTGRAVRPQRVQPRVRRQDRRSSTPATPRGPSPAAARSSSAATARWPIPPRCGTRNLSGQTGASLDPCAAMQVQFELADGQERELVFVLGAGQQRRRGPATGPAVQRLGQRAAGAGERLGVLEADAGRGLRRDARRRA